MQKEILKFDSSSVMEGMVSIRAVIKAREAGVSDRKIEKVLFDREKRDAKARELAFLKGKAASHGFSVEFTDANVIDEMTIGSSHGGIIALCSERTVPPVGALNIKKDGFYVLLDGIEDPYNFGYCLRSLYAAGVDGILVGTRNWFSAAGVVCRASAGASELFPITMGEPAEIAGLFHEHAYSVVAADLSKEAASVYETELRYPVLLVIGGEKRGIARSVLEKCDKVVALDYGRRFGAALSAASAASVLAFEIFRQNRTARKSHDR